jgi:hypothetical protein
MPPVKAKGKYIHFSYRHSDLKYNKFEPAPPPEEAKEEGGLEGRS